MPDFGDKKVYILGQKHDNKNITTLRKSLQKTLGLEGKTKEANDKTRQILKNIDEEKTIYNKKTGELAKVDLKRKEAPLLIRKFTNKKRLFKNEKEEILTTQIIGLNQDVTLYPKNIQFTEKDKVNVYLTLYFFIEVSDLFFGDAQSRRTTKMTYSGPAGDIKIKNLMFNENGTVTKYDDDLDFTNVTNSYEFDEIINGQPYTENYNMKKNSYRHELLKSVNDYGGGRFKLFLYLIEATNTIRGNINKYDIQNMKLRETKYNDVKTNIVINAENAPTNGTNCVKSFLTTRYNRTLVDNYFNDDDFKDGITTNEIVNFCVKKKINCIAYDINGKIIQELKHKKQKYKPLYFVAYNNHIYPLTSKKPIFKRDVDGDDIKYTYDSIDNIHQSFMNINEKGITPDNVNIRSYNRKVHINSYTHNGIRTHNNEDYEMCNNLLRLFGFSNKMTDEINKYNVFSKILKLSGVQMYKSFAPYLDNYTPPVLKYKNNIHFDDEGCLTYDKSKYNIYTDDKNKAYAYALYSLGKIITTNFLYDEIRMIDVDEEINIIKTYFYVVEPEHRSILLDNEGIYTGEHLLYCAEEGIKYTIKAEIEATGHDNIYKDLLEDYFNNTKNVKDEKQLRFNKECINIHIGKFEKRTGKKEIFKPVKICNDDEVSKSGNNYIQICENMNLCYTTEEYYNPYTMKPLTIQIREKHTQIMYEEMKRLNINNDAIVHIDTDAITYLKLKDERRDKTNHDVKDFKKWKSKITDIDYINNNVHDYAEKKEIDLLNEIKSKQTEHNLLNKSYAGAGKTTRIINILEEREKKTKPNEYIILTPSHTSLSFYKRKKKKCDIIHKYIYNKCKLDGNINCIVVDEVGMCDEQQLMFLYTCSKLGFKIYCYGDFNQLPPVNLKRRNAKVTENFLTHMFGKIRTTNENFRNNFNVQYYDDLINNKLNLIDEIKKHSSKTYEDAEYIICYRNTTVKKYNDLKLKHLNMTMFTPGCRIICKTNKFKKYDVYNGYILEVLDINDDSIMLKDEINIYTLPLKKYKEPNFMPAYALTIYALQGSSVNSYFCPIEDEKYYNNSSTAYTIISRIKNKNNSEELKNKRKQEKRSLFKISIQ